MHHSTLHDKGTISQPSAFSHSEMMLVARCQSRLQSESYNTFHHAVCSICRVAQQIAECRLIGMHPQTSCTAYGT